MITGILDCIPALFAGYVALSLLFTDPARIEQDLKQRQQVGPGQRADAKNMEDVLAFGGGFWLVVGLVWLAGAVVIILGSVKMMKLESVGLSRAAAIVAMIPCTSLPCCMLGVPFGIWGIVVLSRREVTSFFD